MEETISVEDAARRLGVSTKTVYRYLEKKKLSSEKIGSQHYLDRSEVEKLALSRHVQTDEKTRLENRVTALYEITDALSFRLKELEEKLAKLQAPAPVQTPLPTVQTPPPQVARQASQGGNIPAGTIPLKDFLHGMSPSSAKRNVKMEIDDWRGPDGHVINRVLNAEQQAAFYRWACNRPGFTPCEDCPHAPVI